MPADPASARLEGSLIAQAYLSLAERWRAVLWHTEVENARSADVAPLLGLSANGVSALAYRAREGLRQAYLQLYLTGSPPPECKAVIGKLGAYVRGGLTRRDSRSVERARARLPQLPHRPAGAHRRQPGAAHGDRAPGAGRRGRRLSGGSVPARPRSPADAGPDAADARRGGGRGGHGDGGGGGLRRGVGPGRGSPPRHPPPLRRRPVRPRRPVRREPLPYGCGRYGRFGFGRLHWGWLGLRRLRRRQVRRGRPRLGWLG
ncbi:hypothetical protein ACFSTC_56050 [Nonomuraea ferruginea]